MAEKDSSIRLRYVQQEILTASKEKLLLITYDIAIGSCKKAIKAMEEGKHDHSNSLLQTAQKAIRELQFSLRPEKAGEFADAMNRLYDYMFNQLVQANLEKDPEKVRYVQSILEDLMESWQEAFEKLSSENALSGEDDSRNREMVGGGLNTPC